MLSILFPGTVRRVYSITAVTTVVWSDEFAVEDLSDAFESVDRAGTTAISNNTVSRWCCLVKSVYSGVH